MENCFKRKMTWRITLSLERYSEADFTIYFHACSYAYKLGSVVQNSFSE